MSIKTHYINDIFYPEVTYNTSDYGSMMKILCERFAADVPEGIITNTEIISNTSSLYNVRYQLFGKPLYINIHNSGTAILIEALEKIDGEYKAAHSFNAVNSLSVSNLSSCRILIVGYDDFMLGASINFGSKCITFSVCWGTDAIKGSDVYLCYCSGGPSTLESYILKDILSSDAIYMYYKPDNAQIAVDRCVMINVTYITRGTGYNQCWILSEMFRASTSKPVSFQMKYGGKYDVYKLYTTNDAIVVTPGADYIVDGVTYKAIFQYLYKFVENTN